MRLEGCKYRLAIGDDAPYEFEMLEADGLCELGGYFVAGAGGGEDGGDGLTKASGELWVYGREVGEVVFKTADCGGRGA